MNKSRILAGIAAVLVVATLGGCGGGGGGGGGGGVADTTAPITAANPGGGTYGSIQSVTLTSNEAATIHYSVDGTDPDVGALNTTSGPSPISGVQMNAGTGTLKFFAIDGAGNREAVQTQIYDVDLVSPTIALTAAAPGPMGLLATATVTWQSDEAGDYVVELGGNGTIGSGTQLAAAAVAANSPVSQVVEGTRLSFSGAIPLWIYVTDGVGHTGSTSVSLSLKPLVPVNVGGELRHVAVLPSGLKAYVARTDASAVAVIDTDPASLTFNTVLTNVAVGIGSNAIAATPDGSRVYVTNGGSTSLDIDSISAIDTSTDTVIATILLGANSAPNGIAITPDGTRAYFLRFEGAISVLDINPASPTYHGVTASISQPLLLGGAIDITQDGSRAVVNWGGLIAQSVDVIDVNPASPTYNMIISSPVPIVPGSAGDVAVTSDSSFAFATDMFGQLCRINLQNSVIAPTGPFAAGKSFALTPDETTLLVGNDSNLRIVKASDLSVTADLPMGAPVIGLRGIAITPDGSRAYFTRDPVSVNSQVVMLELQ